MNNILYFASKHLKWTFENKSQETGYIKYVPGMKYLLNSAQHVQYLVSKYLKRTFKRKSQEFGYIK